MATEAQIAANRENAKHSQGPTSPEGKARSAQNALKTGIDSQALIAPDEDPADLEALKAEYYDAHRPATPEARLLVDTLVRNEWLLRRFDRIEGQLWTDVSRHLEDPTHKPFRAARGYASIDKQLARLQTRINAAQRNFQRALKDLQTLEKLAPSQLAAHRQTQQNQQATSPSHPEDTSSERTQFPAPPHPLDPGTAPQTPAAVDRKCA